jgi:hypothetical protein
VPCVEHVRTGSVKQGMEDLMKSTLSIPNEIWIKSFAYLGCNDLTHSVALVNRRFLDLSSDDSIWSQICERRWEGKLNVRRFFTVTDTSSLEQRFQRTAISEREEDSSNQTSFRTAMTYCYELIKQFGHPHGNVLPPLNMGYLINRPMSWKESYWMAELDSLRETIAREELVHFKFQLIYNGQPSQTGLRHFNADGYYDSPYMGRSEWILHGRHLLFAGMSLLIERDNTNWGWIIGKGERTEYRSVKEWTRMSE